MERCIVSYHQCGRTLIIILRLLYPFCVKVKGEGPLPKHGYQAKFVCIWFGRKSGQFMVHLLLRDEFDWFQTELFVDF